MFLRELYASKEFASGGPRTNVIPTQFESTIKFSMPKTFINFC